MLSADELGAVARICVERDLLAVTDEVYEHLVYEGRHIPLATLPGMAERTVTISSHGKTFSFTGWKVGWACGPADLIAAVRTAKQYLSYSGATPFQHAATVALGLPAAYYDELAAGLAERRDLLCQGLRDAGLETFTPQGTYFATTDAASVGATDGVEFCLGLPERVGVVAVPMSVFYDDADAGRTLVRFAFCKRPEILAEAAARLKGLRPETARREGRRHPARRRLGGPGRRPSPASSRSWPPPPAPAPASSCSPRCSRPGSPWSRSGWPNRRAGRARSSSARRPPTWTCGWPAPSPSSPADGGRPGQPLPPGRARAASCEHYDKLHPFTYSGEHEHYAAGTERVTFTVEGVRVTPFVCYDLRFADEFWAEAAGHRLLRRGGQLARRPAGPLAGAARRPGDREPGLRGGRQPGRRGRRPDLRR